MARILVIDDDGQVRKTLKQVLELEGHQVTLAANGKEGLSAYGDGGADLVITDIIMPEKEGLETIGELRRENPAIRIIAISGGGRMDPRSCLSLAREFGAGRTLLKPFDREELLAAVAEMLGE
jgi:CheY-like chemotaxis protein